MEAIGIGFIKRKAIGAALMLGMLSRDYTITVTEAGGIYTINVQDGKRDNTIVTDNKEFEYESATGAWVVFLRASSRVHRFQILSSPEVLKVNEVARLHQMRG